MAAGMDDHEIRYVAVARRTPDQTLLASFTRTADHDDRVKTILAKGNWDGMQSNRLSLKDGTSTFHILLDDDRARTYVCVAPQSYPTRLVFSSGESGGTRGILYELQHIVHEQFDHESLASASLGRAGNRALRAVAEKYSNPASIDKLLAVQRTVQEVQGVMQDNVMSAMSNLEAAEEVEASTTRLAEAANQFRRGGRQLERVMRCRYYKVCFLVTLLVLAILAYILVPIIRKATKK